jgi:hypothetical protein
LRKLPRHYTLETRQLHEPQPSRTNRHAVNDTLPTYFYDAARIHMMDCKYSDNVLDRRKDNPVLMNNHDNLFESAGKIVEFAQPDLTQRPTPRGRRVLVNDGGKTRLQDDSAFRSDQARA